MVDVFPNDPSAVVDANGDGLPDYYILGVPLKPAGELKPTYSGSSGMQNTVLNTCTECHSSGNIAPDLSTLAGAQAQANRIKIRTNAGTMPISGPLNSTQKALAAAWYDVALADGNGSFPYQYFAPYIEQGLNTFKSMNIGSNIAELQAAVNDNGDNATYTFEYGVGNYNQSKVATSSESISGGGGVAADDVAVAKITGLICNTTYQYRLSGTNTAGTTTTTVFKSFTTSNSTDCDADGIPDAIETALGLNPLNASDATTDLDGDGQTNLAEYQAGRHPGINEAATLVPILSVPKQNGNASETKRPGSLLMQILPVIVRP